MTAGTLAEACATCELHAPDVIILDMFLPDGSGVDLMVPVRRISPNARIIAITGGETWEGFELLTRAKDAGADVSLRKPVPAEVLVEAVERLLP
jgi:DNA-binding NarL/FixJ family response regulator